MGYTVLEKCWGMCCVKVLGAAVGGCWNTYMVSVWIGWAHDQMLSSTDPDLLRDLVHEVGCWVCRMYIEGFLVPGLWVTLLENDL